MVNEFIQLGSRGIRASFYVVRGISYGILGTDVLSSLAVQIDVANKRLFIDREEVLTFEKIDTVQQSVQLVKLDGYSHRSIGRSLRSRSDYMGLSSFSYTNRMDRYRRSDRGIV